MTAAGSVAPAPVLGSVRAMASDITLFGPPSGARAATAPLVDRALGVFTAVHGTCSRFDPTSPLMRVNGDPGEWHRVPPLLSDAVGAAHRAYVTTAGRFDPRVLEDLVRLGYDRSLAFEDGRVVTDGTMTSRRRLATWEPRFRAGRHAHLHLGGMPIDLGGIGKSLALRWAVEVLAAGADDFLLDAGGDCVCAGGGPEGDGWRVGVEDPAGGSSPVAVLALTDLACATSSVRLRHWRAGSEVAHHLIDPATGRPGGDGLAAVTVVTPDPVDAEVTAKVLFLHGADGIAAAADRCGAAALWVTTSGEVAMSAPCAPHVVWQAT